MNYCKRFLGFQFIAILFLSSVATAQSLPTKEVLEKWSSENPQEKVFLQTDKSQYFSGETIWMKAWCALDGTPTFLSKILYIDLVNAKGDVVLKKMYKIDSLGGVAADFDISNDLPFGNYAINAYTLWMLNYPGFIFHKNIFIYQAGYLKKNEDQTLKKLSLQFFPEGGEMVAGIANRVAFKAYDANGFPIKISGEITDNAGKKITNFTSEHDGMGTFVLESPDALQTYTANVGGANGEFYTYPLPAAKKEGIAMQVDNANKSRLFVMLSRAEVQKSAYNTVRIVAQMNGHIRYNTVLNIEEGETTAPITKKNLPPGILQITVFDQLNLPLAERLVFIPNYEVGKPKVQLDSINFKARGKNKYSFKLEDITPASLSVTVTNASIDSSINKEENILSSFLLTSDLKGYIHEPGYYFSNRDSATLHHLDLLLMTHGWRRFEWRKILANQPSQLKYPVESAMSLRGMVTKSDRSELVKDGKVSFVIKGEDSTTILSDATITDKGEFIVTNLHFNKSANVSYQGTNSNKKSLIVNVKLTPAYIDSLQKSVAIPFINLDTTDITNKKSAWAKYLIGNINLQQGSDFNGFNSLGNVTVKAKRISKQDSLNNVYAGGPFLLGTNIDPNDYQNYSTIWQMIQASIPGVRVEGDFFNPTVTFTRFDGAFGLSENGSGGGEESNGVVLESDGVAYFLNELNVSKDVIATLNPGDIGLIKVMKYEAAALGASQGAIILYTKKGVNMGKAVFDKSFTSFTKQGYAIARRYFAPDYEKTPDLKKNETDKRFTLYWNPAIQPSKDGVYRFNFFNGDLPKIFKLLIQGMDKEGQLIYTEQLIR